MALSTMKRQKAAISPHLQLHPDSPYGWRINTNSTRRLLHDDVPLLADLGAIRRSGWNTEGGTGPF